MAQARPVAQKTVVEELLVHAVVPAFCLVAAERHPAAAQSNQKDGGELCAAWATGWDAAWHGGASQD
jgi:hypothetical protein